MFSWNWLSRRKSAPTTQKPSRTRGFRPQVNALEDRLTPSGVTSSFAASFFTSPAATHLQVVTPSAVQVGKGFDIVVAAESANNRIAASYTGTVHLSLGTADAGATLPTDYTFTARDHGVHVFHITLSTTGDQTLAATDTTTSTIAGSAAFTVNPAPVTSQFVVRMTGDATPGLATYVTVYATDASGQLTPDYTGTVSLTSSDAAATLPADYTFTAADHGKHTFQVTFATSGSQTVTATDTGANSAIAGSATTTVATVGAVTHFGLRSFGTSLVGFASPVLVVALDASNHVVANYTGTVHFTSTDSSATLPADYTFTADDKGSHLFSVTYATAGSQTLTATDLADGTIVGTANAFVISQFRRQGRRF